MSKFKIKEGVDPKGRVTYKAGGRTKMAAVVLADATQKQLAELHSIGHPGVVEDAKAKAVGG